MALELFRNLARRKLRSFFTVTGITVGVFALSTMGAMAEYFQTYAAGAESYFSDHIQVTYATPSDFGGGLLQASKANEIVQVEGVAAAYPVITLDAKQTPRPVVSLVPADYVYAADPDSLRLNGARLVVAQGRGLFADDTAAVVLGAAFADELKASVGSHLELPIRDPKKPSTRPPHVFKVVGILKRTYTVPDSGAFLTRVDGETLLGASLAPSISESARPHNLATSIVVYGRPGANLDDLAGRITRQVPGVNAQPPSDEVGAFRSGASLLVAITLSAAILAVVVGGLSVINTMLMAVGERAREIGIKKAVGARMGRLVLEYLLESALIGLLGGLIGLALGVALAAALDAAAGGGNGTFLVTPQLVVACPLFAVTLGAIAGLVPAVRAARLDPVVALRSGW